MCERLLANPLVEDYEVSSRPPLRLASRVERFGVIQFPGSCDERDTLAAAARVGDAVT